MAIRKLDSGDFEIELQVREHGLHHVKLLADLVLPLHPPDRRVASVLLRTIGFTEISPPAAVAKFPVDLKQPGYPRQHAARISTAIAMSIAAASRTLVKLAGVFRTFKFG
jgi:hypothetical protein